MAIDPAKSFLLATLASDVPPGMILPAGVKRGRCVGCNADVYLSQSSRTIIAGGAAQAVCGDCLGKQHGLYVPVMTREQAAELEAWSDGRN